MSNACINRARKVIDTDTLTGEELELIHQQTKAALNDYKTNPSALNDLKQKFAEDAEKQKLIQERNATFNASRKLSLLKRIEDKMEPASFWKGGLKRWLTGDTDPVRDILTGANGVGNAQIAEHSLYSSFVTKRLSEFQEKVGDKRHEQAFSSGKMDRDIAKELGAMHGLNKGTDNPIAKDLANMIEDYEDMVRKRLNDKGAFIEKIPMHLLGQSWNAHKTSKATKGDWTVFWADLKDNIDWDKTFNTTRESYEANPELAEAIDSIAKRWYSDLATGNHLSLRDGKAEDGRGKGTGGSNIARSVSKARKIIMKDGDAFYEMQQKYGQKNLIDAMGAMGGQSARAHGLLSVLGPNYFDNVEFVQKHIVDRVSDMIENADPGSRRAKDLLRFKENLGTRAQQAMKKDIDYLDGTVNIPGSEYAAWGQWARTLQTVTKLGSAFLSMVPDPVNQIANLNLQGRSLGNATVDYFKTMVNAVPKADQDMLLHALGMSVTEARLSIMGDIDGDAFGKGYNNKVNQLFGKVSLIQQASDKLRRNANITNAGVLGYNAGKGFDELPGRVQEVLKEVGIDDVMWNFMRQHTDELDGIAGDKYTVLSPFKLEELDPSAFAAIAASKGDTAAGADIRAKDDTINALRSYYVRNEKSGSVEPDARTRSRMLQGTQGGTLPGEAARFVGQFKSFLFAILSQRIVRDFNLRHQGEGKMSAYGSMGAYLVSATVAGYGAMSLKAMRDGREPAEWNKETAIASLLQGGGLGIMGDLFLGDMSNRHGGNGLTALLGPTAGSVGSMLDLITKARERAMGGDEEVFPSLYRFMKGHVPLGNHFILKQILDPYVHESVAEWISPGSVQRVRDMQAREMGTTYVRDVGESSIEALVK